MTREDAQTKGRRLVSEGRVTIRHVGTDLIVAHVRGDSAEVYPVTWDPDGWTCDCPAASRCSHVRAVQLVVLTTPAGQGRSFPSRSQHRNHPASREKARPEKTSEALR